MSKVIEGDLKTFIKFWLVPLGIFLFFLILSKALTGLIVIGISIFLALAIRPLVRKISGFFFRKSKKKRETLSSILAYLIVVAAIGVVICIIGPVVVNETAKFVQNLPATFENTFGGWDKINEFGNSIGIENLHNEFNNFMGSMPNLLMGTLGGNIISGVSSLADIIMKTILILVLTLLFLLDGPDMMKSFWKKVGVVEQKKTALSAQRTVARMANVVSTYVSRQVLVAMLDGCATIVIVFILSLILGFSPELAIPMGMITMLFYLIPMFGQFIGGAMVTLVLLFSNPLAALIFIIIYIVYAQVENNLISPKIQGDALRLRPIIILISITIGMYMFGLLGAIIAIPIAGCVRVLIEEYPNMKAARA